MGDESSKAGNMNPSHPYYVHHSDQPGHMLVPIKLNGANYQSWSKAMIHALTAKNKLGFIDGLLQAPSQEEKPTEFALWNQCNSLILSWLTHSVETDMAEGVIHAKTAYQVWSDFKDQFSQKNAPPIFQIQKSIATISQGSMSVASYYTKLKALWDELENYRDPYTCDHAKAHQEQLQEDRLMQFLMGLNESYKGVRSNILMMTPLPNVRQAYSLVIQEQIQRQLSSEPEPTENFTIAANVQSKAFGIKNTKTCDHCHRSGHTIEECRTLKYYCKFCDKSGHTEDRCRRKNNKAGPPQQNRASRSKPQSAANMAENSNMNDDNSLMSFSPEYLQQLAKALSTMNQNSSSGNSDVFANAADLFSVSKSHVNSVFTNSWILDSGATDHMTSHPSLLSKSQPSFSHTVNLPNGTSTPITYTGNIVFNRDITLENVLCVPTFRLNLISASKITKGLNCSVTLFPDSCILQDSTTGKMIGSAAESKISEPHIALDSSSPAHNSAPSPSPQDPPLSPQNNRPLPINSTLSSPQIFPLSESSSSSPPQPNDNFQHLRHSTCDRQPPACHQEYFMSAAVNHSSPRTSPRRHTRGVSLIGPFWDHVLGYWQESLKMPDKILFLKYEEIKERSNIHVKRIAEFYGCPFSDEEEASGVVDEIVKLCGFNNLSNLEVNKSGKDWSGMASNVLFRRGETQDWKRYLTPDTVDKLV
ncbi:hypothetical protein ACH5RR_030409 [Cinchona calisaya]|uniref:Sulfotransferase n=1 Tax=Cinchona calisaya TaxID=153742 RepID=A0ABD2YZP8_9GENT